MNMDRKTDRLNNLSASQRALLEQMLRKKKTEENTISVYQSADNLYPLTYGQRGIWVASKLYPDIPLYNNVGLARIRDIHHSGEFIPDWIELAFNKLIRSQDILRTVFVEVDGTVYAKVMEHMEIKVDYMDLTDIPGSVEDKISHTVEKARGVIFDLEKGPLVAITLMCVGKDDYVMLLTSHHIISDGISTGIILKMVIDYCQGKREGKNVENLSLRSKIQFKDYSHWKHCKSPRNDGFWDSKPDDAAIDMGLFFGKADIISEMSKPGTRIPFIVPAENVAQLRQLSQNISCTLFHVFLSAFYITLYRFSLQDTLCVGVINSGRDMASVRDLIGCFIETLPISSTVEPKAMLSEYITSVQEAFTEAFAHKELYFKRKNNSTPRIMFSFEDDPEEAIIDVPGFEITFREVFSGFSKSNLEFELNRSGDAYTGWMSYPGDMFEANYAQCFISAYLSLLSSMASVSQDKDCRIGQLSAISPQALELLEKGFRMPHTTYPEEKTIVDLFEECVARHPDRIALEFGEERLTYHALNARANSLACRLQQKGVSRGDLVALYTERGIDMIVAILAVIKSGAAYVPINTIYPTERVEYIINDCSPRILIHSGSMELDVDVDIVDAADPGIYRNICENPSHVNDPEDAIYVIYTSGTTGKPKGVVVEHKNVVRLFFNSQFQFDFSEKDVWSLFHSYGFDFSVWEMYGALLFGGKLVIVPYDVAADSKQLAEFICRKGITVFNQVPSSFSSLSVSDIDTDTFAVRYIIFGGEALNPGKLVPWYSHFPHVKYINMYGITETTVHVTYKEIGEEEIRSGINDIGMPIPTLSIYVMNNDSLCGYGMPGEMCVSGEGVARGYLNRPALTAERFRLNPFGSGKIYHSGDLVRLLPGNRIEYLGRIDQQVKIRGFRVELGEIQFEMLKLSGVSDAVVTTSQSTAGERFIVSYVVRDAAAEISADSIKKQLRATLPEYMIPPIVVFIDKIPLTANGKLDRGALPKVGFSSGSGRPPESNAEKLIAKAFCDILEIDIVSAEDNFFDLGGHSLKVTELANHIEEATGKRLSLKQIFETPTVEGLALAVNTLDCADTGHIHQAEQQECYDMSDAQRRIFLVEQMADQIGTTYNMPQMIRISGGIDTAKAREAFSEIIRRHAILRTDFSMIDGRFVQTVHDSVPIDMSEASAAQSEIAERFQRFVRRFDLGHAPLLRLGALRITDSADTVLMFDIHHIISDGVSIGIIIDEFMKLYNGETLAPPIRTYIDYSAWMSQKDLGKAQDYWICKYSDEIPVLDLPTDFPRGKEQSFNGDVVKAHIGADVVAAVRSLARKTDTTEYMILLSAMIILLSRYSRQEDIIVGSPVACRTHQDTENMLGMFVNTLAMRGKPAADKVYLDFLSEIRVMCLDAYEHQEYPFERLVEQISITRDLSRNPLFNVMFALQNTKQVNFILDGKKAEMIDTGKSISKFDLDVEVYYDADGYRVEFGYCSDLYQKDTVTHMLRHYRNIIAAVLANPSETLCKIGMLDPHEVDLLINGFNPDFRAYDKDESVISVFEENAEKYPDDLAIIFKSTVVTFGELNRRANSLAKRLRTLGIKPNDHVIIYAKRGVELITAMLAVVKSGAAYIPVDVDTPCARVQTIVELSNAFALLSLGTDCTALNGVRIIDLSTPGLFSDNQDNLPIINRGEDGFYTIFTSGSTGVPKGVMLKHSSVHNYWRHLCESSYLCRLVKNRDVRVVSVASCAFDIFFIETWFPLLSAMPVIMTDEVEQIDPVELTRVIDAHKINFIQTTPSKHKLYMTHPGYGDALKNMAVIGMIGEQLDPKLFNDVIDITDAQIVNMYGPSETTVVSTDYVLPRQKNPRLIIGRPVRNTLAYVVNNGSLAGINVPGELWIGGDGVGKGYLGNDALTSEKYLPNPFGTGRVYRSGDIARFLPDGTLECFGRMDDLVKIHGYRIELGEIKSVLMQNEDITDAVIIVNKDNNDVVQIWAYVVCEGDLDENRIKESLRERLPEYMIPNRFMQLEAIPLNTNGKVNKKALPKIEVRQTAPFVIRDEKDQLLYETVKRVFGRDVNFSEDFFSMGGDSIKAIQISSALREYGYNISMKDIMIHDSMHSIADRMTIDEGAKQYEQGQITGTFQLSPIQRNFFRWNLANPAHFNHSVLLKCREGWRFDLFCMRKSMEAIVKHHDILRATFAGQHFTIRPVDGNKLYSLNIYRLYGRYDAEKIMDSECAEIQRSMRLSSGPLVRGAYFSLDDSEYLFLCFHHLVEDAMSLRIIMEDFASVYNQYENNPSLSNPLMPRKTASYPEWCDAVSDYASSEKGKAQVDWWKNVTADVENYRLPLKEASGGSVQPVVAASRTTFEQEDTMVLTRAVFAFNTDMRDILLSALACAVNEWHKLEKTCVLVEGHGREDVFGLNVSRTVGWFTSMYPVMVTANTDLRRCIIDTKETLRRIPDNGVAYLPLVLSADNDLAMVSPDIMFNYLGEVAVMGGDEKDIVSVASIPFGQDSDERNRPDVAININSGIKDGCFYFVTEYDSARIHPDEIAHFNNCFSSSIKRFAQFCDSHEEEEKTASEYDSADISQDALEELQALFD